MIRRSVSRLVLAAFSTLAVALAGVFVAAPAVATSWVRVADHHLVEQAPVIVEAEIVGADHSFVDGKPFLDYEARVLGVVKGSVEGETITLRSLGGPRPDGTLLRIWGTPRFHAGERALLFVKPWDDGSHRVLHLFQGAFHVVRHDGRDVAYRNLGAGEFEMKRAVQPAPETPRDLAAFVDWIRAVDAGAEKALPPATYRLDLDAAELRAATDAAAAAGELEKFTLILTGDDIGLRWRDFEAGTRIPFRAHEDGQPGLTGGGFQQIRRAINVWNGDPGSEILYRYAGTTTASTGFGDFDGVNAILFDDPDGVGEFDEPFSCTQGGVLAAGGPTAIFTNSEHTVNGQVFFHTAEGDVVTNKNTACFFADVRAAEEVFAHELGHTLGFGHSCGDDDSPSCGGQPVLNDALMRAQAHDDGRGASINSDDRAVAAFVYGVVQTPPATPFGLSASANADFSVDLTWNDFSNNESGFAIDRRGVGQAFEEIATTRRNVESFRDETAPSGSDLEYRVRAFNGAGQSDPSNVAAVTTPGEAPPSVVVATATGPTSVFLEWEDNAEGETGFEVEVRDLGGFGRVAEVGPDVTEVTIENLLVETEAAFRVRSVGEPGESTFSDEAVVTTLPFEPTAECVEDAFGTCLNRERFRVISRVRDSKGVSAASQVSPVDSNDSGIFYFFGEDNWEILVKVLDACNLVVDAEGNTADSFWVFAAATTAEEYSLQVIDTWTGDTATYLNPLGVTAPAITDTGAFATCDAVEPGGALVPAAPAPKGKTTDVGSESSPSSGLVRAADTAEKNDGCVESATNLCLNQGRFRVEATWRDFQDRTGSAQAEVQGTDDSGLLWFFGEDNWEILVKVLDGCPINDHYWVFAAGTTTVEYTLTVTDTQEDVTVTYTNELGEPAVAETDVAAFATCP